MAANPKLITMKATLTDQEIEACIRMKYKGQQVTQETIDADVMDMKSLRDENEKNKQTIKNQENERAD